eukprot:TRINITY_DN27254_c0_g1_i1.p1 TRINITY_DN27254_c0_g1~~TRINITY_DN27254_c0_g1_i1.p1  ORF type:complete len:310 (+),score=32.14 TRINITY_DN27254_c0_g1_i1:83-1012(+)
MPASNVWSAGAMSGWRGDKDRIPWMRGFVPKEDHDCSTILGLELSAFDEYTQTVIAKCEILWKAAEGCLGPGIRDHCWQAEVTVPQRVYTISVLKIPDDAREQFQTTEEGDILLTNGCEGVRVTETKKNNLPTPAFSKTPNGTRRVSKMIIHTLWQSGLLCKEGLTPEAVIVLVSCTSSLFPRQSDGCLLKRVFRYFGTEHQPGSAVVTPNGLIPSIPPSSGVLIVSMGPESPSLTTSCIHWLRVQNLFMHCSSALKRWDGPVTTTPGGKSPLASITAFNRLAVAYFQPSALVSELMEDDDSPPALLDE